MDEEEAIDEYKEKQRFEAQNSLKALLAEADANLCAACCWAEELEDADAIEKIKKAAEILDKISLA